MSSLLIKFETRSNRVKSVCFHPKRPWVLVGLHNGTVQIWDYRTGESVDRFEEHEGPVRGVDFHHDQPIFATGADDYKIKIWNHKLRRCLYTLHGHDDFIRSVQFHHDKPWLVSASDDATIRVWNWQSRAGLAMLTGHNHYIMSAQFHPSQDLIVSASLDSMIRVWDISSLKVQKQQDTTLPQDLFGSNDNFLHRVFEGHDKGVNWAAFHPDKSTIVSASDDRTVRTWRMDESRSYELEVMRGHSYNVSCVAFFKDFIVSNSEDRTIRVWDDKHRSPVQTYRRDDRFWTLAVHQSENLLAAGHDAGLMVFKLERERPAMSVSNDGKYLTFVANRALQQYEFARGITKKLVDMKRQQTPPFSLSCNPAGNHAVAWYTCDNGLFELFNTDVRGEEKKGYYVSAVFFGANKFAVIDKTGQIVIRSASNDIVKVLPPVGETDRLFPGPSGSLVCRAADKVCLFDVSQRRVTAELAVPHVKYIVWDSTFQRVALLSKRSIVVANRRLRQLCVVQESGARIKSVAFDEDRQVLFYATNNHMKFCALHNGETGTLRTLERPIYLVRAKQDTLWYLTREGKVVVETVDNTELNFKLALQQERFRDVLKLIQARKVHGQALVAFLHKSGHPDIAMHFVEDPEIKFHLALECGTMETAKAMALEVNKRECWLALAKAAMRAGDVQLSQLANAKTQNFHSLGLQCTVTGNTAALAQVMQKSNDESFKMQYAIQTGDAETRVALLTQAGQLPLAYTTAKSNGLDEIAADLLEKMDPEVASRAAAIPVRRAPAMPEVQPQDSNWPTLPIKESYFTRMLKQPGALDMEEPEAAAGGGAAWGDEDDLDLDEDSPARDDANPFGEDAVVAAEPGLTGEGAWDDDDLDIEVPAEVVAATKTGGAGAAAAGGVYVVPREGESCHKHWIEQLPSSPVFHIAAGSFASALDLLRRQIGLCDAAPLQPHFMQIWTATNAVMPTSSMLPPHIHAVTAPAPKEAMRAKHGPRLAQTLPALQEKLKQGFQCFSNGQFADGLTLFQHLMHALIFVVVQDKAESDKVREMLAMSREYVCALNVELQRRESVADVARSTELAAHFTHFQLQPGHQILAVGQAMNKAYAAKAFKTAGAMARRFLDLEPPAERAAKARAVIARTDENPVDAIALDYDDRNPFVLCSVTKKPMYRGKVTPIRCPFCHAAAHPDQRGVKCPVCTISALGTDASGLSLASA